MMRILVKILIWTILAVVVATSGLVLLIWYKSPGEPRPLIHTTDDAVNTIEPIDVRGSVQYLITRGANDANPVLLFLHGGPGSPEFPLFIKYNGDLEKHFTVVHWEQRGAGMSFDEGADVGELTLETMIADGISVSEQLKERHNTKKIYLMGHSWGTLLGAYLVDRRPDLYHAFFAIGQVASQLEGEQLSYDWVLEKAKQGQNEKAIEQLETFGGPPPLSGDWVSYLRIQRGWVDHYGGSTMKGGLFADFFLEVFLHTPEYTLGQKIGYLKGSLTSLGQLFEPVLTTRLISDLDSIQVPYYLFQGVNDYQTPYVFAREFYDSLKCIEKGFFPFEHSAHGLMWEEPGKFNALVVELAQQKE